MAQFKNAEKWGEFVNQALARLKTGAEEYGDRSFDAPLPELVAEIRQELLDIAGWSFVAWVRVGKLLGDAGTCFFSDCDGDLVEVPSRDRVRMLCVKCGRISGSRYADERSV